MVFSKEQFEEIGPFYMDDFPVDSNDQDLMLKIFNHLPTHLQGLAIQWGCSDTVFRDDVFVFMIKTQFGLDSSKEYYENPITKAILRSGENIMIDFERMKRG